MQGAAKTAAERAIAAGKALLEAKELWHLPLWVIFILGSQPQANSQNYWGLRQLVEMREVKP